MLEERGIVVIFDHAHVIGEAEGELHFQLIALFILPVLPLALGGILRDFGQIIYADLFGNIIDDTVWV